MSLELYAAYLVACFIIVIVPGPTVTLIVANSLRYGAPCRPHQCRGHAARAWRHHRRRRHRPRSAIEAMGHWFDWLRLIGAAYLVCLAGVAHVPGQ